MMLKQRASNLRFRGRDPAAKQRCRPENQQEFFSLTGEEEQCGMKGREAEVAVNKDEWLLLKGKSGHRENGRQGMRSKAKTQRRTNKLL